MPLFRFALRQPVGYNPQYTAPPRVIVGGDMIRCIASATAGMVTTQGLAATSLDAGVRADGARPDGFARALGATYQRTPLSVAFAITVRVHTRARTHGIALAVASAAHSSPGIRRRIEDDVG